MKLFSNIYSWFENIYGQDFYEILVGRDCNGDQTQIDQFVLIGLLTLGITILTVITFYFILNSVRFSKRLIWGLFLVLNALINFSTILINLIPKYNEGLFTLFEECYDTVAPNNIYCLGFANIIISTILFIILSIILKRFSTHGKHIPFKSL